jgi:hypothetical protein
MTKASRIAIGSGVLAAGLAIAGTSAASAQVRVRGSFPLPHGRISVDIAHGFPVGGYVPYGYDVYEDDYYGGYGFAYEDQWFPCEQRGSRWVIVAAPVHYVHREYRTGRHYRNDRHRYSRSDRRYDRNRYDRRDDRRGDRRYERRGDRDRDRRGDRWRDGRNDRRDDRRYDSQRRRRN